MTNTEMKKYLKNMDHEKLEGLLLEMFKNQPKDRKEVFEITVVNYNEGKELPAKDAAIPDFKKIQKKLEFVLSKTIYSYRYIRPATKRKVKEYLSEIQSALMAVPPQSKEFDKACHYMLSFLVVVEQIDEDRSLYYLNIYSGLKGDEESLFRSVLTKFMSGGLTMERIKQLASFGRLPQIESHLKAMQLMEILISLFKVGDTRCEFMEQLESILAQLKDSQSQDARSHNTFLLQRTGMLYLLCAEKELGFDAALKELEHRTSEPVFRMIVHTYEAWKKQMDQEEYLRMKEASLTD